MEKKEAFKRAIVVGGFGALLAGAFGLVAGRSVSGKKFESEEILAALRKHDVQYAAAQQGLALPKYADAFEHFIKGKSFVVTPDKLMEIVAAKAPPEVAIKFLQTTMGRLTRQELGRLVATMVKKGSVVPQEVTKRLLPRIIGEAKALGQDELREELRSACKNNPALMKQFEKSISALQEVTEGIATKGLSFQRMGSPE